MKKKELKKLLKQQREKIIELNTENERLKGSDFMSSSKNKLFIEFQNGERKEAPKELIDFLRNKE